MAFDGSTCGISGTKTENVEQLVRKIYQQRVLKLQNNMGHKPDNIKGGGGQGSIKVGATGRVSALMTLELESVSCGVSASSKEAGTGSNTVQRTQGSSIQGKMHSYRIPMLASEDKSVEKTTPVRGKLENKRSKLVEIVDLKCGRKPGGKVCSSPIGKKLTFSRLSASN